VVGRRQRRRGAGPGNAWTMVQGSNSKPACLLAWSKRSRWTGVFHQNPWEGEAHVRRCPSAGERRRHVPSPLFYRNAWTTRTTWTVLAKSRAYAVQAKSLPWTTLYRSLGANRRRFVFWPVDRLANACGVSAAAFFQARKNYYPFALVLLALALLARPLLGAVRH